MGRGSLKRARISGRRKVQGFALARVTVRESRGTKLNGVAVQIIGVPPSSGQQPDDLRGTTGIKSSRNRTPPGQGVWESGPFTPGHFDVVVSLADYGPPGRVVHEAELRQSVEFISAFERPTEQARVNVDFVVDPRNPRVVVRVLDGTFSSPTPVRNADVEVIGASIGKTDDVGRFGSVPLPFGKVGVNVSSPGMLSTATGSSTFFTEAELNPSGARLGHGSTPEGVIDPSLRDIELLVELTRLSVVLPGSHPRQFALWASGINSGHPVATDARLPVPDGGDTERGQDGWDLGTQFNNLAHLAAQLKGLLVLPSRLGSGNIQPHQLSRLAICAHGFPDVIDVDQTTTGSFGSQPDENTSLTPDRIGHYRRALEAIGSALAKDATVILACCLVANTETLLTHMSLLWPTVTIVGLRTVGLTHPKQRVDSRGGNPDVFPGIRDSPFETLSKNLSPAAALERETAVFNAWPDLGRLPWLSESSPHATLVRNGSIIKRGNTPVLGAKL